MPSSLRIKEPRFLIIFLIAVISCKKTDPVPTAPKLTPPVARAGVDQKIYLPDQREILLDGSASNDPDGPINSITYSWRKISGPDVIFNYLQVAAASIFILDSGTYHFELEVKDVQSLVARDTVTVTAVWGPSCRTGTELFKANYAVDATLGESIPVDASIASGSGKLVFAGGRTNQDDGWGGSDEYSANIVMYDLDKKTTIKKDLSLARGRIGVAVGANEIFFGGGIVLNNVSDVVDIYDQSSGTMSTAKLSAPRSSIGSGIAGSKVFFAGGRQKSNATSDVVDIYDQNTKAWTVAKLSAPRADISVIASGSKVFFAGGDLGFGVPTERVDIYDINTGQWSVKDLGIPRSDISSALLGNVAVFAGGQDAGKSKKIDQIEFLDPNSMSLTSDCLGVSKYYLSFYGSNIFSAVLNGSEYYYLSSSLLNRYDANSKNWGVSMMPRDANWLGLVSNGTRLFAFSYNYDSMSSGYGIKVSIHQVSF